MLTPLRAALAGIVVGIVLAVLAALLIGPESEDQEPSAAAAEAFLDAWGRSRTATYVSEGTYTRTVEGRPGLRGAIRTAQRPPDRLEVVPGSATGRIGGRQVACVHDGGRMACREGEAVGPYDAGVAEEVAILRQQVVGPARLYDVTDHGAGCFRLGLVRPYPAPPYGRSATFCFDGPTGALRRSRVDRGRAVDLLEVTDIRVEVADRDLGTGQG